MSKFDGELRADIIEVRFAFSGKVSSIHRKIGEIVKKWDSLVTLDSKILQTELDRQLADYEKTRAEFEIFSKKSNGNGEIDSYLKKIQQSQLNASVKDVELSKAKLDQVGVFSPVNGLIISDGGCRVGLYVTPSSASFQIVDMDSLVFRIKVAGKELSQFSKSAKVKVMLDTRKASISGDSQTAMPDGKGNFLVDSILEEKTDLLPGIKGKLSLA
jgi:multidrug resistance efflux pump